MREILFRGKTIGSNEWIYGGYYRVGHNCFIADSKGVCYLVEPDTVSQYTGLDDCYSNKIFEGDIIYSEHDEEYGEVKFDKADHAFIVEFGTYEERLGYFISAELELRGNKWDNKELL